MVDTPVTDEAEEYCRECGLHFVPTDAARRLERELADCKEDYLRRHKDVGDMMERAIAAETKLASALKAKEELQQWVHDLQSGMYINCVYCGHRYGPQDKVPSTMAAALKAHIEQCEKHPMSALKKAKEEAERNTEQCLIVMKQSLDWLASYPGGNAKGIYERMHAAIDEAMKK